MMQCADLRESPGFWLEDEDKELLQAAEEVVADLLEKPLTKTGAELVRSANNALTALNNEVVMYSEAVI